MFAASRLEDAWEGCRGDVRGRVECKTSTAGMTVIGESAMTSPSGMSLVSTETQLPATGSNHRIGLTRKHV